MRTGTVVILTSNYDAGVLQLATQMKHEFEIIYSKAVLFAPKQSHLRGEGIELYERKNSLIPMDHQYRLIAKRIAEYKPKLIFVCDTNLITGRIMLQIQGRVPIFTVVHDINPHPTYGSKMAELKDKLKSPYVYFGMKKATKVILLSTHSFEGFADKYPQFKDKRVLLRLGAHVPDVPEEQLEELANEQGYILFFGRIDKYKGIINLLRAFKQNRSNVTHKIVIAGKGTLTKEEETIISENTDSIILIQRYISDSEMIYLFKNASCTVLPYIEASQSGVLSISYYFGKPVIVSDLEGLTEFVENGKTGVIVHSIEELGNALESVPNCSESMRPAIESYYSKELEWSGNLKRIVS